jgi:Ca2+:H+ antiporter
MEPLYAPTQRTWPSSIILPRTWRGIRRLLRSNYLYLLLIFVPIGIISGVLDRSPTAIFVFNVLAIIPLAMLLNFATEELSANAGQTIGALLNATFGNAVEMIVSV